MKELQLSSWLIGIRYIRKFGILDRSGEVLDRILDNKEFFSPGYFNQIQTASGAEVVLSDPYGGSLRINSSDLIFSRQISNQSETSINDPKTIQDAINFCKNCASRFLAPKIIEHLDLVTQRIGIVYSYVVDEETSIEIAKNYFKGPIDQKFEFRFSSRDIAPITQIRKDKLDYINKIYSSSRVGETEYLFSYDYQHFFEPAQSIISDKIGKIIEASELALKSEFLTLGRN